MPKRVIESGPAMLSGEHAGVGATIDGRLFPAVRNLLADPAFSDIRSSGVPRGFTTFSAPDRVRSINVYLRPPGSNMPTLVGARLERGALFFRGPMPVGSAPAPGPTGLDPAPPPLAIVGAFGTAAGREPGFYSVACALVLHSLDEPARRLTGISPRSAAMNFASSDSIAEVSLSLPATAAGAVGIAWYETLRQADAGAAATAPLYLQEIVPFSSINATRSLYGPTRVGPIPVSNETYAEGDFEELDPPEWYFWPVPNAKIEEMTLQLSWSYTTKHGRSASQGITPNVAVAAADGRAVAARPPFKPAGAITWRLEWRSVGGTGTGAWYTLGDSMDFDSAQYVYSADPASAIGASLGLTPIARSTQNASGLDDPPLAPAFESWPSGIGTSAGTYGITSRALYEGGAIQRPGDPSPEVLKTVGAGDALTVFLRAPRHKMFNERFFERDLDGKPLAWSIPETAGLTVTPNASGSATIADETAATASEDVLTSEAMEVTPSTPHVLRVAADFASQTGGLVRLLLRQFNAAGAQIAETELYQTDAAADLVATEYRITEAGGSGGAAALDAAAATVRFVARHENAAAPRGVTYTLSYLGFFEGEAAPRKYADDHKGFAVAVENPALPYPAGGLATVLTNPTFRPAALDGLDLNALYYFGQYGAMLAAGSFGAGLRIPVRAGEDYGLSTYADVAGVESGSSLLSTAFKGWNGTTLQVNAPIASFAGSGALATPWSRYSGLWTAPADSAFLEITGSTLGRGRVYLMGLQFEKGDVITAFDAGEIPPGHAGYAIATVDLSNDAPGPLRFSVGAIRSLQSFDLVAFADAAAGEAVSYELRSGPTTAGPFSEWVTDLQELEVYPGNSIVQIRVNLTKSAS